MEFGLASITPVRDRCLPVDEAFVPMLPDAGLPRGRVIGCSGQAAMTLALALSARAATAGSWVAAVGAPMLGIEAASEIGLPVERLVVVDADGGSAGWAERVAAAADGFEIIVTVPPRGAERLARKIKHRVRTRGGVLITVEQLVGSAARSARAMSCDLEFTTTEVSWLGVGRGHGHLVGRRATVRAGGRRIPRPIERDLWLPGPDGRIGAAEPHRGRSDRPLDETDREAVALRAG